MKKITLTSIIAVCTVMPVMATPSHTGTFPNNGYMLEDYTYTNAATSTNMDGVYEGTVNADIEYNDCPANSYCDTGGNVTACSTLENGAYPNSAAGSTSSSDCYRACVVSDIPGAATVVSGNIHYGSLSSDTCGAGSCVNGYHLIPGATSALNTTIGNTAATANNFTVYNANDADASLSFTVTYGDKGTITGHGFCATTGGTRAWEGNPTYSDTLTFGQTGYCWCRLETYTPSGGTTQTLSAPWVFRAPDSAGWGGCYQNCAKGCVYDLLDTTQDRSIAYRNAFFGSTKLSCAANTITINWNGASAEDISANDAGTVTYGGDIRTPRAATVVPGKVFKGWTFRNPNN